MRRRLTRITPEGDMRAFHNKQKTSDDYQTPPEALWPLLPYLNPDWTIWECACGKGKLVKALRQEGFTVIGTDREKDFLIWQPDQFDCLVTNPPYSLKNEFLRRAYELGKPFAFLLPITGLEYRSRQSMFQTHGLELLLLDKRLRFERPDGRKSRPWFSSAWFCWRLGLPKQLTFTTLFHRETKGANMKLKDLTRLGIVEDPENPGQGMLLKDIDKPNEQMDNAALAALAKKYEGQAARLEQQASLQRFYQGWALCIVHDRLGRGPHKGWTAFLTEHGLARSTAYRAERLYQGARKLWGNKAEEEVAQRTLTELYLSLGILSEKPAAEQDTPPAAEDTEPEAPGKEQEAPEQEPEPEQEGNSPEEEEANEDDAIRKVAARLSPPAKAEAALNILADLYDDLAGPCDHTVLNTLNLIADLVEAIKAKGHEDEAELHEYQPEPVPEVALAG